MLKTRILTAVVIFIVTLAIVFLVPTQLFRAAIAILLVVGSLEFRRLADLPATAGIVLLILQILLIGLMMLFWSVVQAHAITLLAVACAAWLLMFTRLRSYRADQDPDAAYRISGFFSALIAVTFCWFALSWLHGQEHGKYIIFLLLLIIWASDVGAYFSGKQFGKRKLAPVISPNKTWEGVYGGVALAMAAAFLWSGPIAGLGIEPIALVLMTVVTAITSVGGDLFISIHKRTVRVADAGRLFPGHGGVLDRYDSLLSGAPFFALCFGWLTL